MPVVEEYVTPSGVRIRFFDDAIMNHTPEGRKINDRMQRQAINMVNENNRKRALERLRLEQEKELELKA